MLTNEHKPQPNSSVQQGEIQFYDNVLPALAIGDYTIDIEQNMFNDGLNKTFKRSQDFVVAGNRFRLAMKDIHSVYPPIDGQGQFDDVLPQVILNNRTLPWERSEDSKTPHLAVLLFEASELAIEDWTKVSRTGTKSVKIAAIKNPENGFATPDLMDFSYEDETNNCLCVEITADYFNNIIPRFEELPYLAHVREVNADNKTVDNTNNWFSTVFANRLPKLNSRNIVHLVSLEGFTDSLKARSPKIEPELKVRLVSLASWEFFCEAPKEEFEILTKNLVENHQMLRMSDTEKITNETIKTALEGGYIPLKYETRQGENTTAWYRSPLTPIIIKNQHLAPNFSAESAMVYNKNTGIFDTSYSVAWQTGRLLALSDAYFAKALLQWKRQANTFLDTFFAKQEFYKNIVKIYNDTIDTETDKLLTLEDLMSDNATKKLLSTTLKQSLSDLGFLSRGDIGGKRTIKELVNKAKEELDGLAGIMTDMAFEDIREAEDINVALVNKLFE